MASRWPTNDLPSNEFLMPTRRIADLTSRARVSPEAGTINMGAAFSVLGVSGLPVDRLADSVFRGRGRFFASSALAGCFPGAGGSSGSMVSGPVGAAMAGFDRARPVMTTKPGLAHAVPDITNGTAVISNNLRIAMHRKGYNQPPDAGAGRDNQS